MEDFDMQQLPEVIEDQLQNIDFEQLITNPITNILENSIQEWSEANKAKELIAAANNYNPQAIMSSINQLVSKTEIWFISQHNNVIMKTARDENITPTKWLIKQDNFNWLTNSVQEQKRYIEISINQFDNVIVAFANYAKENSGFSGFVNGFLGGLADPIDAFKGFFGNSRSDREARELQTAMQKSVQQMGESFNDLDQQLKSSIYSAFSNVTLIAIEEMRLFAEQERIRKLEEEQRRKQIEKERELERRRIEEEQINNKSKNSGALMVALLVSFGIIITLLIVLLTK
jgi:hypothetical protein